MTNKQQLQNYKLEFEASLKHNDNELRQFLEVIKRRYDDRMKKLYNAIKICEDNRKEVKNFNKKINEFGNGNNEVCECIEHSNIKICN